MGAIERFTTPVPPAAVSRVLARFDRPALEGFIAVALDLLDLADGDPDLEETGDEQDGSLSEEEPAARFAEMGNGPGCDLADPDEGIDDRPHDGIDEDRENEEDCHPALRHRPSQRTASSRR